LSYKYYEEELNRLPFNDDGYGLSIQIRSNGTDVHTKWLSLTDECKDALLKFLGGKADSEELNKNKAEYWEREYRKIQAVEEAARRELANYLKDPICPATWTHIVCAVRELLLFRDCAKKAEPRNNETDTALQYTKKNLAVCLEFLNLAERRAKCQPS
jgi:hypothetical protein